MEDLKQVGIVHDSLWQNSQELYSLSMLMDRLNTRNILKRKKHKLEGNNYNCVLLSCGSAPIPGDGEPVTSVGRLRERRHGLGARSPRRMQRLFWKQPKLEESHAGSLQFRSS